MKEKDEGYTDRNKHVHIMNLSSIKESQEFRCEICGKDIGEIVAESSTK